MYALSFGWYRHKIALKYNIANFKSVILFRSKTIEESKADYEEFIGWMKDISSKDLNFLKNIKKLISNNERLKDDETGLSQTEKLLEFIKDENIPFWRNNKLDQTKFSRENTIITNSKTNKTKKEKTDEETESY